MENHATPNTMTLLGEQGGYLKSLPRIPKTLDMIFEGLGEIFEGEIFAQVDWGPSGGSNKRRQGTWDPHLLLHAITKIPEGVVVGFQNFAWAFKSQKQNIFLSCLHSQFLTVFRQFDLIFRYDWGMGEMFERNFFLPHVDGGMNNTVQHRRVRTRTLKIQCGLAEICEN